MTYKTILVPYDGSDPANRALDKAIELAKALGSQIVLVYVVEEMHLPLSKYSLKLPSNKIAKENLERLYREMEKDGLEALEEKKKACASAQVPAKTAVLRGNTVEQILSIAKKEEADLVIVGSSGFSGISKLKVLGSVSRKLSEQSRCPVMIVH